MPEIVTAPANVEVIEVDVERIAPTVGVDVPTIDVPLNERSDESERVVEFVPPLPMPRVPVTCVERLICPESAENERQLPATA